MRLFIETSKENNGFALKATISFLCKKLGYPYIDSELYDGQIIVGDEDFMDIEGHTIDFETEEYETAFDENAEEVERCFDVLSKISPEILAKKHITSFFIEY